jgi:hypothetical protein
LICLSGPNEFCSAAAEGTGAADDPAALVVDGRAHFAIAAM